MSEIFFEHLTCVHIEWGLCGRKSLEGPSRHNAEGHHVSTLHMAPTTFYNLIVLTTPLIMDMHVEDVDSKRCICWPVNITATHWALVLHKTENGSPIYYCDTWGTKEQQIRRAQLPLYPQFASICNVINNLGAWQNPPRRWADTFSTPP